MGYVRYRTDYLGALIQTCPMNVARRRTEAADRDEQLRLCFAPMRRAFGASLRVTLAALGRPLAGGSHRYRSGGMPSDRDQPSSLEAPHIQHLRQ